MKKSSSNQATFTRTLCLHLKVHVSANDGGCATPKPKEPSPAHSRRRRSLPGVSPTLASLGAASLPPYDLHSLFCWTTILSRQLCPRIFFLAMAAANPHLPSTLRGGFGGSNGQRGSALCTLARFYSEASHPRQTKISYIRENSAAKLAACWKPSEPRRQGSRLKSC